MTILTVFALMCHTKNLSVITKTGLAEPISRQTAQMHDIEGSLANIQANGLDIAINQAKKDLIDPNLTGLLALMLKVDQLYRKVEMLNIKIGDVGFATAEHKEMKDLYVLQENSGSASSAFLEGDIVIDKIYTNVDSLEGEVAWSNEMTIDQVPQVVPFDQLGLGTSGVLISGTDILTGETVTQYGKVIARSEIDETKIGEPQTVTFYIIDCESEAMEIGSLLNLVKNLIDIPAWLNGVICGIQSVTMEVTLTA